MPKKKENEKFEFKAEIKELLDILINSLYTNREIFLRELVSNASDALDKLRFEQTRGTEVADKDLPLEIAISIDDKKKIVTISDTGIGMSHDEIINNIGTIAKSGSADFLKQLADDAKSSDVSNIIGKFGVGFYSVFMIAKKVVITSKSFRADEKAIRWESDGSGSFEIATLDKDVKRGTTIEIFLKDDAEEFADKFRIESIIKKHSNFISFPINVDKEKINTVSALWREPKSNIKAEQYNEFYKYLTYDSEDPMDTIHVSIDAPVQFNSLMFIPKKSIDINGITREDMGLDLYVRGVLIQHKNPDLLPEYLGFVKGMVDSPDIPLNISRETLQENRVVMKISTILIKQVLSHLEKKAKNSPEEYEEFWKEHGKLFKLSYTDFVNKEKIMELLRFNSSACKTEDELISLAAYTERMKEDQKEVYYYSGSGKEAMDSDPHLEIFKRKNIEVLYMYDPVDDFLMGGLLKYKDFDLVSVEHADLSKLDKFESKEDEKDKVEDLSEGEEALFKKFLDKVRDILGDRVSEVKESKRLKDSPTCLVNSDAGMTSQMQKMLNMMNKDMTVPKMAFEINKDSSLIRNMLKIYKNDPKDSFITTTIEQLYESDLLMEGYLTDPHRLVNRTKDILSQSSELKLK